MGTFARAVAGAATLVLLLAVGYFGVRVAQGALTDEYRISVVLGRTGQGLVEGSDVKSKGVVIGQVSRIELTDDLMAVTELAIDPGYEVPESASYQVTSKTLLGEKQVEVVTDTLAQGPYLPSGAVVDDPQRIVEFQDVLAETAELFDAIDPDDLATLINDGFGAFDGQEQEIARAIDEGARATNVGRRILPDQVPAVRDLSFLAEALQDRGDEFNRLGAEIVRGLPTISENQQGTRVLLRELQRFSAVFDETLVVDRANLDRLFIEGDSVTSMLFAYRPEFGETVQGIGSYTNKFARPGFQHPTTIGQAARFQGIADEGFQDALNEICAGLPPELAAQVPACAGRGGGGGGGGSEPPIPTELPSDLPIPTELPSDLPIPIPPPTSDIPIPIPPPSDLPLPLPGGSSSPSESPSPSESDGLPIPVPSAAPPAAPGAEAPGAGLGGVLQGQGLGLEGDAQ